MIDEAVRQVERYKPTRIVVMSYTDTFGTAENNLELSAARALAVKGTLVAAGLPADRIELRPRGEADLAVTTTDEVIEPLNNRTVVVLKGITLPPR